MKLKLELPEPWSETVGPGGSTWTSPEHGVRVEAGKLIPLPDDRKTWGEAVINAATPPGGTVQQVDIVDTKSRRGWPCTVVSLAYFDAEKHGVEFRVTIFYELLYLGAVVSICVPKASVGQWEAELREKLVPLVQDLDVDFATDGVDYLAELYD